jgi:hypothetical protein
VNDNHRTPTYVNIFISSESFVQYRRVCHHRSCACEEARAAVKRLGAGALGGSSAAGPAFVAGRTSAGVS